MQSGADVKDWMMMFFQCLGEKLKWRNLEIFYCLKIDQIDIQHISTILYKIKSDIVGTTPCNPLFKLPIYLQTHCPPVLHIAVH